MRKGNFCKYKACGAITKHMSGYCNTHNKQWMAGYRYALKELQGCQSPEACTRGKMLAASGGSLPDNNERDPYSLSFKFSFGREGEGTEGFRRQNSVGLPVLPHLAGSRLSPDDGKEKSLGCGICKTD